MHRYASLLFSVALAHEAMMSVARPRPTHTRPAPERQPCARHHHHTGSREVPEISPPGIRIFVSADARPIARCGAGAPVLVSPRRAAPFLSTPPRPTLAARAPPPPRRVKLHHPLPPLPHLAFASAYGLTHPPTRLASIHSDHAPHLRSLRSPPLPRPPPSPSPSPSLARAHPSASDFPVRPDLEPTRPCSEPTRPCSGGRESPNRGGREGSF